MKIEISDKQYEKVLNWHDGMLYCSMLVIDGKDDWRMPTIEELVEIYHSENDFRDNCDYWSSSEYGYAAWIKQFATNNRYVLSKALLYYVRPVRTIEPS
jgi:hypothetical protein